MSSYISKILRKQVVKRAGGCCEYCLINESDSFLPFEVEHIVAKKHGGGNEISNLAYACPHCNQHKGTDLTTFLKNYDNIVRIFNPRLQVWEDHFSMIQGEIIAVTETGEATIKLLKLNEEERVLLRNLLGMNR